MSNISLDEIIHLVADELCVNAENLIKPAGSPDGRGSLGRFQLLAFGVIGRLALEHTAETLESVARALGDRSPLILSIEIQNIDIAVKRQPQIAAVLERLETSVDYIHERNTEACLGVVGKISVTEIAEMIAVDLGADRELLTVARSMRLPRADLNIRRVRAIHALGLVVLFAEEFTNLTRTAMGMALGKRHHSSLLTARLRAEFELSHNAEFRAFQERTRSQIDALVKLRSQLELSSRAHASTVSHAGAC